MSTIDEYLETVTPTQKLELQRIRSMIKQLVPDVEERISYHMPSFTYKGETLLLFSAFKNHMSLFGAVKPVEEKLEGKFEMSGKGTLQFTEENPLPDDIIMEIVLTRKNEIDTK